MAAIEVVLDRVGATYEVGEHVTGVVAVLCDSATSHRGIVLNAQCVLRIEGSERSHQAFKMVHATQAQQRMLDISLKLSDGGKLPVGETTIPFSFPLTAASKRKPLPETYHGVYIKVEYTVSATISYTFSQKTTEPLTLLVSAPGQAEPTAEELARDQGTTFNLNSNHVRQSRKLQGATMPEFEIDGAIARFYNDIDAPLSGYVRILQCTFPITSVEIQLIRSENVAVEDIVGKENTEVQNIQIGDGDVAHGVVIPLHMMFPKWYTCAALITDDAKVEFEVNLVITLEGHTQLTQNLPIRLYRSGRVA